MFHNIAFSSEKVLSESEERYAQIKQCLEVKTVQKFETNLDFVVGGQQEMEELLQIIDLCFGQKQ